MQSGLLGIVAPLGVGNLRFKSAGARARSRTAQAKERDLISLKDWGAIGNGTADDTAAVSAADADANAKFVPTGVYDVTLLASDLDGPYWGRGQIRDSADNLRAPWYSAIKAAPASFGLQDSVLTAFNGDLSKVQIAMEHRVTGATTLGQPTTGYSFYAEASAIFARMFNSSGHNQSTAGNDGRTMAQLANLRVDQAGQGDCACIYAFATVQGTKASSTHFLANPASSILAAQIDGFTDGVYLNPYEIAMNDNGFDVAGIGWVVNMKRTVATGAKTACWIGYRSQSTGSVDVNSHFSAAGLCDVGLDFSNITTDANKAAIALKPDDRIYGNVSNANGFYPSAFGSDYITYSSTLSSWSVVAGGTVGLTVTGSASNFTGLSLVSTSADANGGPFLLLDRNSASPAVSDNIGGITFRGRDSGGNTTAYAFLAGSILDPVDTSEDGQVTLSTQVAGTLTQQLAVANGIQVGSPASGFLGTGTLNAAGLINSLASIRGHSGTAIPAGGTAGAGILLSSTTNFGIFFGSGAPTLSAAAGSLYIRTDNAGANLRLYSNTTGSTTWAAITSA